MSQEHFYRKRCKRLGYALSLSCLLNISLLAFGIYEWQDAGYSYLATSSFRPLKSKLYRQSGKELPTLTQSLREIEVLDFESLVAQLIDETVVAEGYKKQDLALSLLENSHNFDIARGLGTNLSGSNMLVRRLFTYMSQDGQKAEIILYPDLPNEQFSAIKEFAKNEKWPFTTQGLFERYKQQQIFATQDIGAPNANHIPFRPDESLKALLVQSNEYRCVEVLLGRKTNLSKEVIFDFVLSLDYPVIKTLYNEMLKAQDFSPEVRRGFLLMAMPHSAQIFLETDLRFCVHSLTDKQVDSLLTALAKQPKAQGTCKEYAIALLEGPRSKAIWNKAVSVICENLQLDPHVETRNSLLERFGRLQPIASVTTEQDVKKISSKAEPKAAILSPKVQTKSLVSQSQKPASNTAPKPAVTSATAKSAGTNPSTKPSAALPAKSSAPSKAVVPSKSIAAKPQQQIRAGSNQQHVNKTPSQPLPKVAPKTPVATQVAKQQVAKHIANQSAASFKPTPSKAVNPKPSKTQEKPPFEVVHVVKSGDTLWQLSKQYGVDMQKIKTYNKLTSDALKPGSTLRIPQNPPAR